MSLISPWIVSLGWVLIHFLWEGCILGALAALGLRLTRSSSAQVRYGLLCSALFLCFLTPFLTGWWLTTTPSAIAQAEKPTLTDAFSPSSTTVKASDATRGESRPSNEPTGGDGLRVLGWSETSSLIGLLAPRVATIWFACVLLLLMRRWIDWLQGRQLCRSGTPADAYWVSQMQELSHRLGVTRAVELLESARVEVPTLIGWSKPILLVPLGFLTGLRPDLITAVLAHELAHVRRHDYLVNLVQVFVETLLFYHPVIWWLSHKIREERENCCDDMAVHVVESRLVYIEALTSLEERRGAALPTALAASGGSLLNRVRRLASLNKNAPDGRALLPVVVAVLALVSAVVGGLLVRNIQADARLFATLAEAAGWTKSDFKHEVDRSRDRLNRAFDANGHSLLDVAAQHGLPEETLLMLLAGANPNLVDANGRTPIFYALNHPGKGQDRVRDLLILRGARLEVIDSADLSPLMEAVASGTEKTVAALLRLGANPHPAGAAGAKLMALARERGPFFIQMLQSFISPPTREELSRGQPDPAMQRQFLDASRRGALDEMTELLRKGAKLDDPDDGGPAIAKAVQYYQPDAVVYLLHLGANPNQLGEGPFPPLYYTFGWIGEDSDHMQDALLACGARADFLPKTGYSLLTDACYRENEHAIQWLIWMGVDPARSTPQGTPMYLASKESAARSIRLLQRNGVTEAPYQDPSPAWQMLNAVKSGDIPKLQQLLGKKVAVDLPLNSSKDDGLMTAIAYRQLEVARFLLAHGANPNYQDASGDNPLRVSIGWRFPEMETFREQLLEAGANPNLQDRSGQTPFIAACRHGDLAPKITQLMAHGANINQADYEGHTGLFYAERSGRSGAAIYLRQHGATDQVMVSAFPAAVHPQAVAFVQSPVGVATQATSTAVAPPPSPAAPPPDAGTGNTNAQVAAILKQARDAYAALTSYTDHGTVSSQMGTFSQEATFVTRLQRPSFYCVTWKGAMGGGAVWSDGTGDYLRMMGNDQKQKDRQMALAGATGISNCAAATIPAAFFQERWGSVLSGAGECELKPDETVDNVPCHVIASTIHPRNATMTTTLWVGSQDHLIHKSVVNSSGPPQAPTLDDAQITQMLQRQNKPVTPAAITALREQLSSAQEMAKKMMQNGGITFTQIHQDIATNQTFNAADFKPLK